jgi:RimJ/RimL family protein N-acetyltransferase
VIDQISGFPRTETLKSRLAVTIRPLRADDREKIAAAVRNLDRESIYFRLFSYRKELTEQGLDRIMAVDRPGEVVLVVTQDTGDARVIGSGRYVAAAAGGAERTAEVAFMVDRNFSGQGIAGCVLRHLAGIARGSGIAALTAEVLSDNKAMLAVFAKSGLPMQQRREGGVVHVTLSLRDDPA